MSDASQCWTIIVALLLPQQDSDQTCIHGLLRLETFERDEEEERKIG